MKLSKLDRLMLVNQFKILEKLHPQEAGYYSQHRLALEGGYALHYSWMFESLNDEMSEEECQEVIDILSMYRSLIFSYDNLGKPDEVDERDIQFKGFDGNNESKLYFYTMYFIVDLGRFNELARDMEIPEFNSHQEMLGQYKKMLLVWKGIGKRGTELSIEDMQNVIEASR